MGQDFRFALRMLGKSPGFTLVAVIILALGIGANTAIFSVVHAVLLRPLPYRDSDRLVKVWETNPQANRWGQWVAYPDFSDWRQQNRVFEEAAAFRVWTWNLTGGDHPETLIGFYVTPNLFHFLGVEPALGRNPDDEEVAKSRVVVLSHDLWRRRFGSDRGLVGRDVTIDGQNYTVLGIMPAGFHFPMDIFESARRPDVWMPLGQHPERQDRGSHNFHVLARLKPGVSVEAAEADVDAIVRGIGEIHPGHRGRGAKLAALARNATREVRPALLILLAAIGSVLLIACANIANLQLARATGRLREIAVRQALGAGPWRVLRQLLVESIVLAVLGGAGGLLLAAWGVEFLVRLAPDVPRLDQTRIDPVVVGFTAALALATGVLFGMAPAFQSSRIDVAEALKEGARSSGGSRRARTRKLLVVAEMALTLVILTGAGLLIRSFLLVQAVDLGFDPKNVLTAILRVQPGPGTQGDFFRELVDRLGNLPGVEAVGGASASPLQFNDNGPFRIEGQPPARPGDPVIYAERPKITPDYLRAMGIPLLKGRSFTWADDAQARPVAIVNEALVRQYWPGEDPLRKRLSISSRQGAEVWREVVGAVRDTIHDSVEERPRPVIYVPVAQHPSSGLILAARTRADPTALVAAMRQEVAAVRKDQPLALVRTMESIVADSLSRRRFQALLLGIFGAVALMLSAVGIYGVVSYSISQRTAEIGIRIALGAKQRDVFRLVVGEGLVLALVGIGLGLGSSLALARLLEKYLYGVRPTDPTTFLAIPAVLLAVASLACYLPARRAARVDPIVALRQE